MRKTVVSAAMAVAVMAASPAQAASEAACSIWLCLPAGFPDGCGAAHSEFRHRIKKGKGPLPAFSSCAVGGATGRYQMGYQQFHSCKEGYTETTDYIGNNSHIKNACVSISCPGYGNTRPNTSQKCDVYAQIPHQKPNFVKMWVDGDFIGQYHF